MILYIGSNVSVFGVSDLVGRDSWIALAIALVCSVPFYLCFARIISFSPGRDFFDIVYDVCPTPLAAVMCAGWFMYGIILGGATMRANSGFIAITALPFPPWIELPLAFIVVVFILVSSGMRVQGKWGVTMGLLVIPLFVVATLATLKNMDLRNILPMLTAPAADMAHAVYRHINLPMLEVLPFIVFLPHVTDENRPHTTMLKALAIVGPLLVVSQARDILLLGESLVSRLYFPSYTSLKILRIGNFLSRLEKITLLFYIVSNLTRVSIMAVFCAMALAKLFGLSDYKKLFAPVCMLILACGLYIFDSVMQEYLLVKNFLPIGTVFQVIFPLMLLAFCEYDRRKRPARTPRRRGTRAGAKSPPA